MDNTQNGKVSHKRSLPHAIEKDNKKLIIPTTTYFLQSQNDKREFSSQDIVDNIIEKYKHKRMKTQCNTYTYSNQNLNRSNALFHRNVEFKNSVQNFYNYVKPQYFTLSSNKVNNVSVVNRNVAKPNIILNENIVPKVTFTEQNGSIHTNSELHEKTGLTSKEKHFADKTTYCRPVLSLYNEDFMYKTMERNSKLKQMVKTLAIARQREKENVSWNNFINELKNKHSPSYNAQKCPHPLFKPEQYTTPEIIDDYDNTRSSWQQSSPCSHLLQDIYEGYYHPPQPTYRQPCENKQESYSNHHSLPYSTHSYCYPTSSQGRLIIIERERRNTENQRHNRLRKNNFKYENNHRDEKYSERYLAGKQHLRNIYPFNHNNENIVKPCIDSDYIQTNHNIHENICKNKTTNESNNVLIDKLMQTFETDKNIEGKHDDACKMKNISLENLENKIETLISCINNFIIEIKSNRKSKRKANGASVVKNVDEWRDELLCSGLFNDTSESTLSVSNFYPCAKPSETHEILRKIHKFCSKDNLTFKSQPCSVNITFEVPTRDCSTEVTKSLSKQTSGDKVEIIEEISTPEPMSTQQITIAVNTDPFNFLTLLKISTEAVMRLLSNLPSINYHSYLALLPFLQTTRKVESHYICNVCGAAFNKPSALNDHIEEHNLGKTRDCRVCRHVLGSSRTPPQLFKCKFCGQRFTRAYCCELHQRPCARRLGQTHDVASSLILLR